MSGPIVWNGSAAHLVLNPRLSEDAQKSLQKLFQELDRQAPHHIWLLTSGSTGESKLVALSRDAFLSSAEAVNVHLQVNKKDKWLCVLPEFHVGGLGIFARAYLSGSSVLQRSWSPQDFFTDVEEQQVTLSSLVPTQVYDLVKLGLRAPACLRAIVVGGASLPETLYHKARDLGWPLLPSYGMTETCSQVATAELSTLSQPQSPLMKILSHVQMKKNKNGQFLVRGSSLLTGYGLWREGKSCLQDPKELGWFASEDYGFMDEDFLLPEGRVGEVIKVHGEKVDLNAMRKILMQIYDGDEIALVALPDERAGSLIALLYVETVSARVEQIKNDFNLSVMPYEKIQKLRLVTEIPRTELGKLKTNIP